MSSLNLLKKTAILSTLVLSTAIFADLPLALVGGATNPGNVPFADHISTSNTVTPINLGITSGGLNMVAMNAFGRELLGFQICPIQPYAALISPSGAVTLINLTVPPVSTIFSVSINDSGNGIIGGANILLAGQPAYAPLFLLLETFCLSIPSVTTESTVFRSTTQISRYRRQNSPALRARLCSSGFSLWNRNTY
jgi:hypothetical protein